MLTNGSYEIWHQWMLSCRLRINDCSILRCQFWPQISNPIKKEDRLFIKLEGQESLCPVNIQFVLNEDIADRTYAFYLYVIIIQRFNMTKKITCMKNKRNILFHHARSWQHPISKSLLSNISKKSSKILSHWEIYPRKEAR